MNKGGLLFNMGETVDNGDVLSPVVSITRKLCDSGEYCNDKSFFVQSALVIIGLVTYQLLIASWLATEKHVSPVVAAAIDDVIKFIIIFTIARFVAGQPINDKDWMKEMFIFAVLIVAYDVFVQAGLESKLAQFEPSSWNSVKANVKQEDSNNKMLSPMSLAVSTTVKWAAIFAVQNFVAQRTFDKQWCITTGGFCFAAVVYDVFITRRRVL